ncbi:hypothetical protein, partial [Vibrio parahaemolyticus]|uniref:hypothetical protein n=1 Tax=Vibrio parahaemolyticus TaxID=670 RepID=UPI00387B3366
FYGLSDSRTRAENADLPKSRNELLKRLNLEKPKNLALSHNAALRREQRNTQRLPHCALNTKLDAN